MSLLRCVCLVLCVFGTAIRAARAQSAPAAAPAGPDAGAAADPWSQGQELYKQKKYEPAVAALEAALAAKPGDPAVAILLGQSYFQLGRYKDAEKVLRPVVSADAKNLEAWTQLAATEDKLKATLDAANAWDQVARLGKDPAAAARAAGGFTATKHPKEAASAWQLANKLKPLEPPQLQQWVAVAPSTKDAEAVNNAYQALSAAQPDAVAPKLQWAQAVATLDPGKAHGLLEEVLKADPKNPDAWDASAKVAAAAKDDGQELAALTKLIEVAPKRPGAQRRLGDLLWRTGKKDEARKAYEAQLAVGSDTDAEIGLVRADLDARAVPAALARGQRIAKADPKNANALAALAWCQLEGGDAKSALNTVGKFGDNKDASAQTLWVYGRALLATQQVPKARATFTRLLAAHDPRAHEGLGDTWAASGDFKKAAEAFNKTLSAHEQDVPYLLKTALARLKSGQGAKAEELLGKVLTLEPNNQDASRYLGRAKLEKGEVEEAIKLLQTALQKFPDDPEVNFAYGKALYLNKDYEGAAAPLQKALAKDPNHPEANALAGLLYVRAKDPVKAEKALTIAVQSLENFDALLALGEIRFAKGNVAGTEGLVRRALALRPQDDAAQALSTRVHFASKRYDMAEKGVGTFLFRHPDDRPMLIVGGEVASARNDYPTVVTRLTAARKAAALDGNDSLLLAAAQIRTQAHGEALSSAQDAVKAGVQSGRAYSLLAYAQFKTGDKDGSRKSVAVAVQKGADDAYVHLIRGEEFLDKKDKKNAKAELIRALAQEPNNDAANALAGDLAMASGENKQAVAAYRKSLANNAAQPKVSANLVRALVQSDQAAQAQRELAKLDAASLPPDEVEALRGRVQSGLGNFKKARENFEKAVAINPKNYEATYYQGENYLKLPHYEKAIALMEQAQKLEPNRVEAASRLATLYAESGDRDKASRAMERLDKIESDAVAEQRKSLPPDQIKTVAVGRFANTTKDPNTDWIGVGVAESLTADLSKVASLNLVERSQVEQVKSQLAQRIANEDNIDPKLAAEFGKMVAAQWLLVGSYQVAGDSVRINARMVDVNTSKVERSASQAGSVSDLPNLQKRLALELVGRLSETSDEDLARIGRGSAGNAESYKLASEAKLLQYQGDARGAQARYREAVQADAANVSALQGLSRAQKELGTQNTVAILDFKPIGDAPSWIGAGLPEHFASKLAKVDGIQIVERNQLDKVKQEMAFNYENEDLMDEDKLPQLGKTLSAGCVLIGSYQEAGDKIQLNARLVDIASNKDLVGERVMGPQSNLLELQDELAKKIVYALIGVPSEEELEALKTKQTLADYQKQMKDLEKKLADNRQRIAAGESLETIPEAHVEEEKVVEATPEPVPTKETTRAGADVRFSKGSSGFVPSLVFSLWEFSTHWGNGGFILGWSGDNFFGGRPIGWPGQRGGPRSFGLESGFRFGFNFLHFGRLGAGVGGDLTLGFDQYLDERGTMENPESSPGVMTDFVINLRPYAQADFEVLEWLTLVAHFGLNIQFLNDKKDSGTGVFGDVGARLSMDEGDRIGEPFHIGYRFNLLVPADQKTASQYIDKNGRGLVIHGINVQWEDGDAWGAHGIYAALGRFGVTNLGTPLTYVEGTYEYTFRAIREHRAFVSPLARGRVGIVGLTGTLPSGESISGGDGLGLLLGLTCGAEIAPFNWLMIPIMIGHDWILSKSDARLSGYNLNVGVSFVL